MSQLNESDSLSSQNISNQQQSNQNEVGDQNIVNSKLENGGIVIQGRESHVEIHQYFGTPLTSNNLKSTDISNLIELQYFEPETIYMAEGSFWMGSLPGEGIPEYETPQHQVFLPAYRIGKYPVTNKQYELFIREKRIAVPPQMGWDGQKIPEGKEEFPVIGVTWYEAIAYCEWLGEKTERHYSLPNEAQWEKACRGGNKTIYPWGDEFDTKRCNQGQPKIAPVNKYPEQNDYGCFDFVGNVRQWTCTLWGEDYAAPNPKYTYPWDDDGRNNLGETSQVWRVVRGSSFQDELGLLRCSARYGEFPESRGYPGSRYSFRVVLNDR